MLCDAGPLVALIDRKQAHRAACKSVFSSARLPLTTTWPCLAEAMHILGRNGGHRFQNQLWEMWSDGSLRLHDHSDGEASRMAALMAQYQNLPMDLADASIVAAAEVTGLREVFTLDSDFRIYRLQGGDALRIIPD